MTPLPAGKILFVGDSITHGMNCPGSGSYPSQTIALLNETNSGTWSEITARLGLDGFTTWAMAGQVDIYIANFIRGTPDYIFLYLGANDHKGPDGVNDSLTADDEASWKAAYIYTIEALHAAYPSALMYIGKSYYGDSSFNVKSFLTDWIFPWTDDLVAAIPYLYAGIRGYEVLIAGLPDSMDGDRIHPTCAGHLLLAQAIVRDVFGYGSTGKKLLLRR